jgi:hypothetical protein
LSITDGHWLCRAGKSRGARTEIKGGFEYDGWTQIENGGHINDERIVVPAGAYDPHPKIPQVAADCQMDYAPLMPKMQPKYSVVFGLKTCLAPSQFLPVPYRAWLPPFNKMVYVQKIPVS